MAEIIEFYNNIGEFDKTDKDVCRTYRAVNAIIILLKGIRHVYVVYHKLDGGKCTFTAETHFHIIHEFPTRNGTIRPMENGIWHSYFFQEIKKEL
ncbi:hypothetical protein CHS0354_001309 [Potamilus streckersoni]|uniref:Uncharacterized protein n=1 Tax=Potamilus streckersoni TaxID=2493646 RepID=A0AAE0RV55_9BIVA|nr:hypothetical protein CHS0354_001309 [Potamilus streckersoni]